MRIGIDATFFGTAKPTGLAVYTWNIVNELARLHEDIVVFTSQDYGFALPSNRIRPIMKQWDFLGERRFMVRPIWMELIFPRLIRREGIDVLFSTVPGGMANCPVPHLITVHDIIPVTFPVDHPRSVQWSFKYRLPKMLRRAGAVIADSEYTKQDIVNCFDIDPSHIKVIGLGYDRENFRRVDSAETLAKYGLERGGYIATVGNATIRKNHDTLIHALGLIRHRVPHKLVLAGPVTSDQELRLRQVARLHEVEDRLVFAGYVPYNDLPAIYSGSAVFAYISLYEGFGLPVLEAMACGTPVLASATTSIPEVAGDAAVLVDPLSAEEVGRALETIITDSGLSRRLMDTGLKRVKYFSWEDSAKQTLELLKNQGELRRDGYRK